jgi:hypothetical protein
MTYESQSVEERPKGMPTSVKWAIGGLWFQAVVNVLAALVLFLAAKDRTDHGQSGAGLLRGFALLSLVVVVLLIVCAVKARSGTPWVWWLVLTLEAISLLSGLVTLTSGNMGAVVGIVIAVGIATRLFTLDSREWFGRGDPFS